MNGVTANEQSRRYSKATEATPEAGSGSGPGLAEHGPMAIRDFTDSAGVTWRVWSTTPARGAVFEHSHKAGWLTFESAEVRKRLAPIPPGWEEATVERLDLMCRAADVVRRRSGAAPMTPDPDAPQEPDRPGRPEGPDLTERP